MKIVKLNIAHILVYINRQFSLFNLNLTKEFQESYNTKYITKWYTFGYNFEYKILNSIIVKTVSLKLKHRTNKLLNNFLTTILND